MNLVKQILLYSSAVAIAMVVYLLAGQVSFEKSAGKRVCVKWSVTAPIHCSTAAVRGWRKG